MFRQRNFHFAKMFRQRKFNFSKMFRLRKFHFNKMFPKHSFCFGKMFRQRKFYKQKKLGIHIHGCQVDYFLFLVSLSRQSLWVLRHRQYFGIAQQPEPTTNIGYLASPISSVMKIINNCKTP